MFTVDFSEFRISDYFTVENVQRSILPPREVSYLTVPGRDGAYYSSSRYGVREITIDIIVKATTNRELMNTMRFLAFCLDIDRPTELVLSDEPDRTYYAILSDNSDMEEIMTNGRGSLLFICPDPYAYASELKTVHANESGILLFDNQGTAPIYPTFQTIFTQDASFVSYTSPDGIILIGTPADTDKPKVRPTTTVLYDNMEQTAGWTNAGAVLDSGRQNMGTLRVDPSGDGLQANDYGQGTAGSKIWHGPGFRRNFSEPVQDFTFKTRLSFSSQDGTNRLDGVQRGRLEIYLFSASGKKIGKLIMRDSTTATELTIPEIMIGESMFLKDEGKLTSKKVSQKEYTYHTTTKTESVDSIIKKYKISLASFKSLNGLGSSVTAKTTYPKGRKFKVKSKTVTKTVYPEHIGSWNDFFGEFTLERKGKTWYAEISRMDGNFKKKKTIKKTFVDHSGKYPKDPVAYVVISFLQYETAEVTAKMIVTHIDVKKHNAVNPDTQTPAIFHDGDVLEVNLEESTVHLNGDLFMNEVDIGSTFFAIEEGLTEVLVSSDDAQATHSADFFERFI